MRVLNFKKIDAFTRGISSGNPAGYILLNEDEVLTDNEMQKIACELTGFVNEMGYVHRVGDEFYLKFYSSECEVAFCGHATIAIMYDLLRNNQLLTQKEIFINVKAGKLSVFNHIKEEDAVYIMAPEPKFLEWDTDISQLSDILGIKSTDIDHTLPVELIDGGLRTLIIPVKSLSICLNMLPVQNTLRSFCLNKGVDIMHISTNETFADDSLYRTRVFAPKFGYLEDPATGSGNAAFGYYLIKHNLWSTDFTVEQGPDKKNPNFVKLKKYNKKDKVHIIFGGCGTTRIQGNYHLHGSNT